MKGKRTILPAFGRSLPYTIGLNYYWEGIVAYQKKYVFLRSYALMGIFGMLLVTFLVPAIVNQNYNGYLLALICLAGIFVLWYNPRKQRRMLMEAVRELEDERYQAECDGKMLKIFSQNLSDEVPESRIPLQTADIWDLGEFFLVCDGKRMFYILPKIALGGETAGSIGT